MKKSTSWVVVLLMLTAGCDELPAASAQVSGAQAMPADAPVVHVGQDGARVSTPGASIRAGAGGAKVRTGDASITVGRDGAAKIVTGGAEVRTGAGGMHVEANGADVRLGQGGARVVTRDGHGDVETEHAKVTANGGHASAPKAAVQSGRTSKIDVHEGGSHVEIHDGPKSKIDVKSGGTSVKIDRGGVKVGALLP